MRFFGISEHISGMADIRGILAAIDPAHTLDDLTLSVHHWAMGRARDRVPLLEHGAWRDLLREQAWDRFHDEWRDRLEPYDAFICFHPVVFALLYQRFNKPLICQVSTRYEYPYSREPDRWRAFNAYLREGVDAGTILLSANNPYDAAYTALFVERPVPFVPSLCEYARASWRPERDDIVYYAVQRIADLEEPAFIHRRRALPPGHAWTDVARCRAIAHFPYNVSTMSMAEQYMMGVPLLFPSIDYAVSLYANGARLFEQNSWTATFDGPPGSAIEPAGGFPRGHDPNDFADAESLRHWLRYADFYDETAMPGVAYFSSLDELHAVAREGPAFLQAIHARMRDGYKARRSRALDGWAAIIDRLK